MAALGATIFRQASASAWATLSHEHDARRLDFSPRPDRASARAARRDAALARRSAITGCGRSGPRSLISAKAPASLSPSGRARRFLATTSSEFAFGARCSAPARACLLYYFAQRLFSALAGFWTVVALNVTPIFNLGSLVMTIDPLSIFFWVAAFYTFWLALERTPEFSWWWPLTGLLIGLGFLCKFTNALELISVLLVLALVPRLRLRISPARVFICSCCVFALCTIPPIVWNSQHAWITLAHLQSRGSLDEAPGFHPLELLTFLGEHFVDLFAVAFPRVGLGDDRELAARATAISRSSIFSGSGCRSFSFTRSSPATKRPRQTGMPSLSSASAFLRFPTGGNGRLPARARAIGQMPRSCLLCS